MTDDADRFIRDGEKIFVPRGAKIAGRRLTFKNFDNDASVAFGQIDDGPHHAVIFERAGVETVSFALTPEALAALRKVLTNRRAGHAWSETPKSEWKLVVSIKHPAGEEGAA